MTNAQRLTVRASEIRQRLNEIGGLEGEALTDEVRAEETALQTEYRDTETKLRAAVASDEPVVETRHAENAEGRELRALAGRANMGAVFEAAVENRATDGAIRELQDHLGLTSRQVPLAMLTGGRAQRGAVEHRAVTPAPANVGTEQDGIIPYVFPASVAAFMGIDQPTVGTGEKIYPVLTKKLDVRTPAENADADETTGSFSADTLSPGRLQAAFIYSREDRARFEDMDGALRMNLSAGLMDGLDQRILAGTNGLLTGTNLPNHAASAQTTFEMYKAAAYARVDGRYAVGVGDIRMVMGSATYAHAATRYRASGSNSDGIDAALDVLMAKTSGVRVSAHVPAVASTKQNMAIRLGMARDAVAPIWEGVTLIPDEVTLAKKGQIVITAVMLFAVKILRVDGFYKQETQHA